MKIERRRKAPVNNGRHIRSLRRGARRFDEPPLLGAMVRDAQHSLHLIDREGCWCRSIDLAQRCAMQNCVSGFYIRARPWIWIMNAQVSYETNSLRPQRHLRCHRLWEAPLSFVRELLPQRHHTPVNCGAFLRCAHIERLRSTSNMAIAHLCVGVRG